jgi:mono/diheme cytochrome c family protein
VKLGLTLAATAATALLLAGCGGGDDESTATPAPAATDAAALFEDNCSSCHTLAAANASGRVGPNLDDLRPGPDLVKTQVTNGGGSMPSFKGSLSPAQIQAIADYVAENAGA